MPFLCNFFLLKVKTNLKKWMTCVCSAIRFSQEKKSFSLNLWGTFLSHKLPSVSVHVIYTFFLPLIEEGKEKRKRSITVVKILLCMTANDRHLHHATKKEGKWWRWKVYTRDMRYFITDLCLSIHNFLLLVISSFIIRIITESTLCSYSFV